MSSIISYLCYGRYQQTNKEPAKYLNSIFPVLQRRDESDSADDVTQKETNRNKNKRKGL